MVYVRPAKCARIVGTSAVLPTVHDANGDVRRPLLRLFRAVGTVSAFRRAGRAIVLLRKDTLETHVMSARPVLSGMAGRARQ